MPIYMDIHHVPGIEAIDLAEAHRKDILIQDDYHCKCMTYWLDEPRGVTFCLIEAPDKSAVEEMHMKSHGFVPHKIIEVKNEVVESFLGRIHDPGEVEISDSGLKVFSSSAFRVLMVAEMMDEVLLHQKLGLQMSGDLMKKINGIVRREISIHGGREVEHAGAGFIVSFSSALKASTCALSIQKNLSGHEKKQASFKIAVNAGNPVSKSDQVFGDTIQLARHLFMINYNSNQIIISNLVKDLLSADYFQKNRRQFILMTPQDEALLESLFGILEENWQEPDFTVTEFGRLMPMSKSQLYRKTLAILGMPPNQLLKDFRLDKARELLKSQSHNISQATFDSGFTSPSYFTKCFKKKFGLLPASYINSL